MNAYNNNPELKLEAVSCAKWHREQEVLYAAAYAAARKNQHVWIRDTLFNLIRDMYSQTPSPTPKPLLHTNSNRT